MIMGRSKRLEIIFHNGEPEGIRIYMRHLSTIKAYVVPRIYLNEAKKLTGVDNPGVYFLINDETGSLSKRRKVYPDWMTIMQRRTSGIKRFCSWQTANTLL